MADKADPVDTFTAPSFSLSNRLQRLVWNVVYLFVFRLIPGPFHGIRAAILRGFGARIGKSAHIYPGARIWAPWNLEVGSEAGIANGAILYNQGKIFIGRRAVISQGAHLCAGTHDYEQAGMPLITRPIRIGDYAWITAEVFVHPGVNIGEGAVIGARSVVTRNIPAWTVCGGCPCKPLKNRTWRPS
ncbi:MAG: acetyltransferase [Verrucomicrobiales bacterium]|nr:acetyltransferase [Verrucomicrobiales bacterium]